jgi:hypothetical protein
MVSVLFDGIIQAVIKWWKRVWFEAKLKARLDMIELDNRIQSELERELNKNRSTGSIRLILISRRVSPRSWVEPCN